MIVKPRFKDIVRGLAEGVLNERKSNKKLDERSSPSDIHAHLIKNGYTHKILSDGHQYVSRPHKYYGEPHIYNNLGNHWNLVGNKRGGWGREYIGDDEDMRTHLGLPSRM